jgi:hypothetical protein
MASDRLIQLLKQRALTEEHLSWLESEISSLQSATIETPENDPIDNPIPANRLKSGGALGYVDFSSEIPSKRSTDEPDPKARSRNAGFGQRRSKRLRYDFWMRLPRPSGNRNLDLVEILDVKSLSGIKNSRKKPFNFRSNATPRQQDSSEIGRYQNRSKLRGIRHKGNKFPNAKHGYSPLLSRSTCCQQFRENLGPFRK